MHTSITHQSYISIISNMLLRITLLCQHAYSCTPPIFAFATTLQMQVSQKPTKEFGGPIVSLVVSIGK